MTPESLSQIGLFGIGLGMMEMVVLGGIAVLLFGKNLPQVAKQLGKSYRDFRGGLNDLQSHMDISDITSPSSSSSYTAPIYDDIDDLDTPTAPKFEPPPAEPTVSESMASESTAQESSDSSA